MIDAPGPSVQLARGSRKHDATTLVGKPVGQAEAVIERWGCKVRIVGGEGAVDLLTLDSLPGRVNLTVRNGEVEEVNGI